MGKGYEQVRKHSNEVFMFHHSISSNDGPEVGAWKSGSFGTFLALRAVKLNFSHSVQNSSVGMLPSFALR
jgi:hypothetical protein